MTSGCMLWGLYVLGSIEGFRHYRVGGCRVWAWDLGFGFRVWSLWFGLWGLGFRFGGLGLRLGAYWVWGLELWQRSCADPDAVNIQILQAPSEAARTQNLTPDANYSAALQTVRIPPRRSLRP